MKLSEWLKKNKVHEQEAPSITEEALHSAVEELWFSLCDNPNQQESLEEMLEICRHRGGERAVQAALQQLAAAPGASLPQILLADAALQEGRTDSARRYYQEALRQENATDFFQISANLGNRGYPQLMVDLLLPLYDLQKHGLYPGMNLFIAALESGQITQGVSLLERLKKTFPQEIETYLPDLSQRIQKAERAAELNIVPDFSPQEGVEAVSHTATTEEKSDALASFRQTAFLVALDQPPWAFSFPGVVALLPLSTERKRVGLHVYANTTPDKVVEDKEGIKAAELALGIPLLLQEKMLFESTGYPVLLVPTAFNDGPQSSGLEPDVQSMFGVCARENLDYIIAGTVYQDRDCFRIRSWILDRDKKSARIVSKDIPFLQWEGVISELVVELLRPFAPKRQEPSELSRQIFRSPLRSGLLQEHMKGARYLLLQQLIAGKHCVPDCLPLPQEYLATYTALCAGDSKSQLFFLYLLSGMWQNLAMGGTEYKNFRQQLYFIADKNRYAPPIKATFAQINRLLMDRAEPNQ